MSNPPRRIGERNYREMQTLSSKPRMKLPLIRQDLQDQQDFFVLVGSATVPAIFPGTRLSEAGGHGGPP